MSTNNTIAIFGFTTVIVVIGILANIVIIIAISIAPIDIIGFLVATIMIVIFVRLFFLLYDR